MKQIAVTDAIMTKLKAAGWDGVDVNNIAIYEATALNTLPLRKDHPIFKGAVVQPSVLRKMAAQVTAESLPLQVMHNQEVLPIGRVFAGEVINGTNGPELRTLFWVDKTHQDVVDLINNSTVDQVSVNFSPKNATCSVCGFDFIGPEATFDHWYSGKDPEGHQLGENGVHAIISDLINWSEMSAVTRGGAVGARIASAKNSFFNPARIAAAADAGPVAFLTALQLSSGELGTCPTNTENSTMDLAELVAKLEAKNTEILTLTKEGAPKDAKIVDLTAQLAASVAKLAEVEAKLAEVEAKLAEAEAAGDGVKLSGALKKVGAKILTLTGKAADELPADDAKLIELVEGSLDTVRLSVAGSTATGADADHGKDKSARFSAGAFRTPKTIAA